MESRSESTLVIMLDADGLVYSDRYIDLLKHVIDTYGETIKKYRSRHRGQQKDEPEKATLISDIKNLISTCSITSLPATRQTNRHYTFIGFLDEIDTSILDMIFMRAVEALTERINEKKLKYKQIILMSGSSRNTFSMEIGNAIRNGTRLFCYDLKMYAEKLGVALDTFLLGDIGGDLPAGESFSRILKHHEFPQAHPDIAWDINKIIFMMAAAHYLKLKYNAIDVEFYDDMGRILSSIFRVFQAGHADVLLPTGLSIDLVQYSEPLQTFSTCFNIRGTGRLEPQYAYYMRELIKRSPVLDDNSIDPASAVDFKQFVHFYCAGEKVSHLDRPFSLPRTLVVMVDADGHVYNMAYRILLFRLMDTYTGVLKKIHRDVDHHSDELAELIPKMKQLISETDVYSSSAKRSFIAFALSEHNNKESAKENWDRFISKCADLITCLDALDRSIMDLVFMRAAELLTAYIKSKIPHYQRIILMSGSNRCSYSLDVLAMETNGTRLFCHDLDMYAKKLRLTLDKHLFADTVGNLRSGESFSRILMHQDRPQEHVRVTCDQSKAALLMDTAHHVKLTYGSADIELCDDVLDILNKMKEVFHPKKAAALLPKGISCKLTEYDDHEHYHCSIAEVNGTGRNEKNYAYYVNKLIEFSPRIFENVIDVANKTDLNHFINVLYQPSLGRSIVNQFLEYYSPENEREPLLKTDNKRDCPHCALL